MRLLVCGSRGWTNYQGIENVLDQFPRKDLVIMHGGANGADSMAAFYCRRRGVRQDVYLPAYEDTTVRKRQAPLVRNEFMCNLLPDRVVAFWDGLSWGTKFTLDYARRLGIPTEVWRT